MFVVWLARSSLLQCNALFQGEEKIDQHGWKNHFIGGQAKSNQNYPARRPLAQARKCLAIENIASPKHLVRPSDGLAYIGIGHIQQLVNRCPADVPIF